MRTSYAFIEIHSHFMTGEPQHIEIRENVQDGGTWSGARKVVIVPVVAGVLEATGRDMIGDAAALSFFSALVEPHGYTLRGDLWATTSGGLEVLRGWLELDAMELCTRVDTATNTSVMVDEAAFVGRDEDGDTWATIIRVGQQIMTGLTHGDSWADSYDDEAAAKSGFDAAVKTAQTEWEAVRASS